MADILQTEAPRRRGRPPRFAFRREEVLRAAARVFTDHGFRQATLEDVARELGITRPALYHYAVSKDELLAECLKLAQATLQEAVETAGRAGTGEGRLRLFFRAYAELIVDDFARCFVLTEMREMGEGAAELNRRVQRGLSDAVQAMVRAGVDDHSLRSCNPADVSRLLFGAFNGIPRWYRPGGRTPGQIADAFLDLIVGGLRG